ncbi:trypsin-like serine peptidase [Nocardiopsis chromatogenes]|uniref:trypsin-like serine peptidase n=1 Tax=Nocardiopsis chromatogenes TaxID=280239 RepID=UPI0003467148|nr:trypsin-like serine protease [Nocardiopsis chromatogenes]
MTPSLLRILVAPLVAAALAAGATGAAAATGPAGPAPAADGPGAVRHTASEEPSSVLDYWTAERMAAARPIGRLLGGAADGLLDGVPGYGAPDREHQADGGDAPVWTGGGTVARTTGRVFLSMDGRDFTCTASVVRARNASTVVTAGHCLKDGTGAWASKWVFVPGYDDGEEPYGRYTAREMLVTPEWARRTDDSRDFGAAVLREGDGGPVQEATGAQRISFSGDHTGRVRSFGYPARSPYDGRTLRTCSGPTHADRGGTTARGMSCDMTEGSSGGPWFAGFDSASGRGTVVSVVSFKYASDADTQYGPVLGASERRVFNEAQDA